MRAAARSERATIRATMGLRAERIHVGCVEKVDAGLERAAKERLCGALVENPRPPLRRSVAHAAETQPRDGDSSAAEGRVLHGGEPSSEFQMMLRVSSPMLS